MARRPQRLAPIRLLCLCLALLAAPCLCSAAAPPAEVIAAQDYPPSFQPDAAARLKRLSQYVAGLDSFSFEASVVTCHRLADGNCEERARYKFAFKRPNQLSMTTELADENLVVTADGKEMLLSLGSSKTFQVREQPDDVGTLVGWLTQEPAFRRLFSPDLSAGWLDNVRHAHYEPDTVDGVPCDHIEVTFERTEMSLWVRRGEAPLPVKLTADLSRGAKHQEGTLTTEISWKNWNTDPQFDRNLFVPKAPEGFTRVDAFPWHRGDEQKGAPAAQALIGAQAPPFNMKMSGGDTISLAKYRGRSVLVLEFWATWCRPCRYALQDLEELTGKFPQRGVAFVAVNLMEDPDKVASFREKNNMALPVALDLDGSLAEQLRVEALPTSVVIGREGTVQAVHVGYQRGFVKTMRKELDALVQGVELAEGIERFSPGDRLRYRLGLDRESYCAVFVRY